MAITWSKEYTDMNHSDWTQNGGITFEEDQHGGQQTVHDGVNNTVSQSPIILAADGSQHVISFWLTNLGTSFYSICNQGDINPILAGAIAVYTNSSDGITANFRDQVSPTDATTLTANFLDADDGEPHHFLVAVDGNTGKIFFDGSDISASVSAPGAGYGGLSADDYDFIVGAENSGARPMFNGSNISRVKVARAYYPTDQECIDEYDAEIAALSSGGSLTQEIVMPIANMITSRMVNNITAS